MAEEVCIAVTVKEDFLEWNDLTFTINFYNGGCRLTDVPADHSVKMDIGTLTTLFLGCKTAQQLARLERIEGSKRSIEVLDDVLQHIIPCISDYI